MRLLTRIRRVEVGAAAAAAGPGDLAGVGLVWTAADARVDASALAAGEYVACDLVLGDELSGAQCARVSERVTTDARDFGWVYDSEGVPVGRVIEVNGSLLRYSVGSWAGRPHPDAG